MSRQPAKRPRLDVPDSIASKISMISGPSFEIEVGKNVPRENGMEEPEMFTVHLKLAEAHSRILWTVIYELPDVLPSTFRVYIQYLYYGFVDTPATMLALCQLYVLGETLQDRKFQKTIMDLMLAIPVGAGVNLKPTLIQINVVYRGTPARSPARQLIIDRMIWTLKGRGFAVSEWLDHAERAFVKDLMEALVGIAAHPEGTAPWIENPGQYHRQVHAEDGTSSGATVQGGSAAVRRTDTVKVEGTDD